MARKAAVEPEAIEFLAGVGASRASVTVQAGKVSCHDRGRTRGGDDGVKDVYHADWNIVSLAQKTFSVVHYPVRYYPAKIDTFTQAIAPTAQPVPGSRYSLTVFLLAPPK